MTKRSEAATRPQSAGDGAGLSLREALGLANADGGTADDIEFASGLAGPIMLTNGELTISSDVTIDGDMNGDNAADITVNAAGNSRVFSFAAGTATLDALTITGGSARGGAPPDMAAGSSNVGSDLTIVNSTITDNIAAIFGGGIMNTGANANLTLVNTTLSGNQSLGVGGGGLTNNTVDRNPD